MANAVHADPRGYYPRAVLRLLDENKTQRAITPRAAIAHSAAGRGSLFGWWNNPLSKGLECHVWIAFSGLVEQYMSALVQADANGEANPFAFSIETESSVSATEPWTAEQVVSIIDVLVWFCTTFDVPARIMAIKTDTGLAWHILFGAPGPWTKAKGKTCPGAARIAQFRDEIVPAVYAALIHQPIPAPAPKGFLMALTDLEQEELLKTVRDLKIQQGETNGHLTKIRQWTNQTTQLLLGNAKVGSSDQRRLGMFRRNIAAALKE